MLVTLGPYNMKRILAIITGVVLVFSLTLTAFAASLGMSTPEATKEGDIFSVTLKLTENPGVVSITVSVTYPSSQLTLLTVANGGAFDGFNQKTGDGNVTLTFETRAQTDNYYSGDIATILFQVADASFENSLIMAACDSAINSAGNSVNFESAISLVTFADDDSVDVDDGQDEEEEEIIDEDEIIDDEPTVTTTATKKTEKTTTTEKTTKKTEKKTEATTTTVTTTTEATTTTVSTTTEVTTTPEVTTTTESTSDTLPSDSESSEYQGPTEGEPSDSSSDAIATGNDYSKRASGATVVLAVSVLITTVLLAGGIEVYKRFFVGDDNSQEG